MDRLLRATERLDDQPESGRIVPELPRAGYREILYHTYRIVYRFDGTTVWIVAVVHGNRMMEAPE